MIFKIFLNRITKFIIIKVFLIFLLLTNNIIFCKENIEEFTIKKIVFRGLKRIALSKALNITNIHIGDKINKEDIKHTIHNLFSSNNFENIQIMKDGNNLIIDVKEYPIISNIVFSGNKLVKEEILKNRMNYKGIKIGEFINYANLFNFKNDLENFYFNNGNLNIKISTLIIPLSNNRVDINFIFNEGNIAKIKQINIIGNQNFSYSKLVSVFRLYNKISWWNFYKKSNYQQKELNNDLKNLNKFYLNHGYVTFDIYSVKVNLTSDMKEVFININIFEGEKYKVSDIKIYDNDLSKNIKIIELIKSQVGKFYNFDKVKEIKREIQKSLNIQGYIYPNIEINNEVNKNNKTVEIHFNINYGKRFYVRHIYFQGNYITKDSVLRREINQLENTYINTDLVNQGKSNLNNLGYFEYVDVKKEIVSDISNNDIVDITYIVKEKNNNNINAGFGIGTESGINFQLNIQQDNWIGSGNYLSFIGNKNNNQTYLEFSFIEPFFTMKGVNLGWKVYYNNINTNYTYINDYYLRNYGLGVLTGFPVSKKRYINFNLDYIHNTLLNVKPQITVWHYLKSNKIKCKKIDNIGDVNFSTNDIFLTLSYNYNDTDNIYFPNSGSKFNLIYKLTTYGSDNKYYKIFLDSSKYFRMMSYSKWLLMHREYFAYSNSTKGTDVPFYDYFYLNNFNTIRGFYNSSIGPKAIYYKCNDINKKYENCSFYKSDTNIGGNSMFINTIELVIPTPTLQEEYTYPLRISLFIDSGALWNTNRKLNKIIKSIDSKILHKYKSIRMSSGVSLQWMSPIGPIVFSYAQPIKKCRHDKLEQFQFNIGKSW